MTTTTLTARQVERAHAIKIRPEKGAATHPDPVIRRLYGQRRAAATKADWGATSWQRMTGWGLVEAIAALLDEVDPDGDWRYEGYDHHGEHGGGWYVKR